MKAWDKAKEVIDVAFQKKGRNFFSIILFWSYCLFYISGVALLRDFFPSIEWQLLIFLAASLCTPLMSIIVFNTNTSNDSGFIVPLLQVIKSKVIWQRLVNAAPVLFIYTSLVCIALKFSPYIITDYKTNPAILILAFIIYILVWGFYYTSLWLYGAYVLAGVKPYEIVFRIMSMLIKNIKLMLCIGLRLSKYLGFVIISYILLFLGCYLFSDINLLLEAMRFKGDPMRLWVLKVALLLPISILYFQLYIWLKFITKSYSRQVLFFFDPEAFRE